MKSLTTIYEVHLKDRNYLKMFEVLNQATQEYLAKPDSNPKEARILVELNIDLLEILGASKQYEMEFNMHGQLIRNRNAVFGTLLKDNPIVQTLFEKIIKGAK